MMKKNLLIHVLICVYTSGLSQNNFPSSGDVTINGNLKLGNYKNIIGGFGAVSTNGIQDWNDSTVARSGNAYSLLSPTALNSPQPSYYHSMTYEYSSKNGAGNLTQFAIPYYYGSANLGYYYRTRYANSFTPWMRILTENTAGYVGIGTTNPTSKLELSSNANTFLKITTSGETNDKQNGLLFSHKRPNSSAYSTHKIYSDNYNLRFEIDESATFMNNNVYSLTLAYNGKVGVGTTSPITDLTLKSGTDGICFQSTSNTFNSGKVAVIKPSEAGSGFGDLIFETYQGGSGGGERLRILNNGKVGIGTSIVPDDYLMAVDGKLITEKVVVRNSNNWPDFVFDKNYTLPSLSSVQDFIAENHHLPEVPSALEIQERGHDLAEMNRLLLKKVEELTLYLLEERALNIKQQNQIDILNEKIDQL